MVIGITILKFDLNQNSMGEIEPEFKKMISELSLSQGDQDFNEIISLNDRFRLFYNHTTGIFMKKGRTVKNFIVGRLKESPYKCLSYYHQEVDESQYLIVGVFERDVEIELYESIFYHMTERITPVFQELVDANLRNFQVVDRIESKMRNELKFAIFQIDRLANLTKTQKIGLIFSTEERVECLKILREGPVSKSLLAQKIQTIKPNANIEIVLKPLIELNIVRRDWARGKVEKHTGKLKGEGEYLFLIKDVGLIRKPPSELIKDMKNNAYIGNQYMKELSKFYEDYDPLRQMVTESETLAQYLMDPDIYDFLALLETHSYPMKKIPNVLSEFTNVKYVLNKLDNDNIIKIIKDTAGRQWICLIAEIAPIIIFPEYLVNTINDRAILKIGGKRSAKYSPITREVALIGLELLENTYNDKIGL